jgi:hypothetical protein
LKNFIVASCWSYHLGIFFISFYKLFWLFGFLLTIATIQ